MAKQRKRVRFGTWCEVLLSAILIAALVICQGCGKKEQPSEANQPSTQTPGEARGSVTPSETVIAQPRLDKNLDAIVKNAKTWKTDFEPWFGKLAPEFVLTDITGVEHKLSDFRGKDVLLVFWATWCGPCKMEIPHLIELRKTISQDKLKILAISFIDPVRNTTEMVKDFVAQNKDINYTVFSVESKDILGPFNEVTFIPCSFFINSQGMIRLATVGALTLADIKAILGIS